MSRRAASLPAALACLVLMVVPTRAPRVPAVPLVYSDRADDTWNRLFALLFTRTFLTRYRDEFPDRGPFDLRRDPMTGAMRRISARAFERYEEGDRAIDALPPAFLNQSGPHAALREPLHGELVAALKAALADRTERTPLARVLMQADLWSAYEPLASIQSGHDVAGVRSAAGELTGALARLIGRLALTPAQITAFPGNYQAARRSAALPDLFRPGGEWMEVAYRPFLMHEAESQFRRPARVFVRPAVRPADPVALLARAVEPRSGDLPFSTVALVLQVIAIDNAGRPVGTPLVSDVQIRTFEQNGDGSLSASVDEYELSRRKILTDPASGGLVHFGDRDEAYVPLAGNDYGFATPAMDTPQHPEPTLTTLHARCAGCHGPDLRGMMTFAVQDPRALPPPRVLSQPNDERARAVAQRQEGRDEFKRLIALAGLR